MYDPKRNIFFIHIPKAGGSSIERAHGYEPDINKARNNHVKLRHKSFYEFKSFVGRGAVEHNYPMVFCVVRNIYERLRSSYRHFLRFNEGRLGLTREVFTFADFIRSIDRFHKQDRIVVKKERLYLSEAPMRPVAHVRHIQPMEWWLDMDRDECIYLDFGNLQEEYVKKVGVYFGITQIVHNNKTPSEFSNIVCAYDRELIDVVQKHFAAEIARFKMNGL